jgi:hypothetical protein
LGFITRRKGFQKLFENVFVILEKEKVIGIYLFSVFGPKASFLPPWPSSPSLS